MIDQASNLLGVVGLTVAERIEVAAREVLQFSGETAAALVVIGYDLGPSNDELRRILRLSHSGTVRLIDRLVDAGLVERRPGRDGREVALYISRRGRVVREEVLTNRIAAIKPLLVNLTRGEQKTLIGLLKKVLSSQETTDIERRSLCRLCDSRVCVDCPIPANFRDQT